MSNATPNVGDQITFTVTLSNSGPDTATGVQVTDLLPAGLTFVSATPSQGSYDNASGVWTVGTVSPGVPQTLSITATVVSPAAQTNTATISDADQFDPNTGNNTASATETPQQADLSLVKFVNGQDADSPTGPHVAAGSTVTFTYVVTDTGNVPVSGVVVRDDNGTPANPADDFNPTFIGGDTNTNGLLDTTETWTYTATATALAGQQTNVGTVTGQDVNTLTTVTDDNPANYFGDAPAVPPPTSDFDADNKSDIPWQSNNGTAAIWLMDGTNATFVGAVGPFNPGPTWHIKATGDFNGDSKADIIWQHDNGLTAMWQMDGTNATFVGAVGPFNPEAPWDIKATGDFNGDGKSDIIWQHDNGLTAMWQMDGTNATFVGAVGPFNPGATWEIKGTGDFNGDGKDDIIWQGEDGTAGDLADGRHQCHVCRRDRPVQSGAELGDQGHRRFQRRRQGRHHLAGPGRHAGDLADGRHQCHVCRRDRPVQSGPELGDQGHRRFQRRRQGRHHLAGPGRHAGDLADGRHRCGVDRRRRLVQPGVGLARDHLAARDRCRTNCATAVVSADRSTRRSPAAGTKLSARFRVRRVRMPRMDNFTPDGRSAR